MISDSRFVIIAGTARNVGKTTLISKIIKHQSPQIEIITLKFISLKEGDKSHHHYTDSYLIIEETNPQSGKDTAKMLRAGAKRSFLITSQKNYIQEAIHAFRSLLSPDTLVLAESAHLRKYIKPYLFVVIDRETVLERKGYIDSLISLADYLIDDVKDYSQIAPILSIKKSYQK